MITRRSFLAACGSALAILAFPFKAAKAKPNPEPKPPGCICPACGSPDILITTAIQGKPNYIPEFTCYNCGAEGTIQVSFSVQRWPGID